MDFTRNFYQKIIGVGSFLQHFLLLAIRLYWGFSFFQAGWGKLNNIQPVINFFGNLGIPLPTFNAYLVGGVETIGGLFLLFGFASRLAAIPLSITMIAALFTAHINATSEMFAALFNIHGNFEVFMAKMGKLTDEAPFNYLLASLVVLCFGPGKISIDFILEKLFSKNKKR